MSKFDVNQFIKDGKKSKSNDSEVEADVGEDDIEVKASSKPQSQDEGGIDDLFVVQETSRPSGFEEVDLGEYKATDDSFSEQRRRKVAKMEEVLQSDKEETKGKVQKNIHGVEPDDIREKSSEDQIVLDPEKVKEERRQRNRSVSEENQEKISKQIMDDLLTGSGKRKRDRDRSLRP